MTNNLMVAFALLGAVVSVACQASGSSTPASAPDAPAALAVPRFEVDPTFPKLPNNWVMGDPSSIAVDRRDHVWILHRPRTVKAELKARVAPPVLEFDAQGVFVQAWGGPSDAYEWPDTEHGIYVDHEDHVWVGGNNPIAQTRLTPRSDDMLLKFTNAGKLVLQIGKRDKSGGNADTVNLKEPADVFVYAKTNEAFVADGYGNRRVIVLDAGTGAFKRMWGAFGNAPLDPPPAAPAGSPYAAPNASATPAAPPPPLDTEGQGPPQFGIVHAIEVSNDGLVYVADRANRRVQVFTVDGEYVNQVFINRAGPSPSSACGLAFSPDPQQQFLYVSDFGNGHMVIVNRKTLEVVGQFGERSAKPGDFQNAHHIAVDSKGTLYTAEVQPGIRIQKFVARGTTPALTQTRPTGAPPPPASPTSAMSNPYRMLEAWPTLGPGMKWGAAIGIIPDGQGGTWLHFRSEPPIIHFDASGKIVKTFADGMFVQAHGFCRDRDGNFWAGDSGPFNDRPETAGKGFVMHKFTPDGKLLMTLGKPGVSKAGPDTFIGPTACAIAPNGDVIIADGHWPRPTTAQQDGDRIVRYTTDGKFVTAFGKMGPGPGEFIGPHAVAFDSQGRLFVADRSNNRVQVFDKDLKFLDDWRHFGRPSGVFILKDDTLIVSDSESGFPIGGPPIAPEGGGNALRNPGWKNGIRIGSARDGSLRQFIPGTRPEGLGADELGNVFGGLTGGCDASRSGGCLQKFVKADGGSR